MNISLLNIDVEPLTTIKATLSQKIANLVKTGRLLAITVNGKPEAIVVPYQQFLDLVQKQEYAIRTIRLDDWEKRSKQRHQVTAALKSLFDTSRLRRKGQKPYKQDALRNFGKS